MTQATNTNYFAELASQVGFTYVRKAFKEFIQLLDPELPLAPSVSEQETILRLDSKWKLAAEAYISLKTKSDEATKQADFAKAKLISLCSHSRESGFGVSVTRFYKQGNVDYKSIPQLQSVDLDSYRGKAKEEVRVTLVKEKTLC